MTATNIRARFAPSPTGFLHVGGLRTALFNYLFAKKYDGQFILRIEDTDRERLVAGSEENIKQNLKLFSLNWDEEYKQSQRLAGYKALAEKLIAEGQAYYEESEKGKAVRFRVKTEGLTKFEDLVHGLLEFKNNLFKDPIILKSDGYPVYNFANVADDHDMGISHVIRGEEFLPSTPIHIQIYEAFGWQTPKFAHLPLILDKGRKKLSKRAGDLAVKEYIDKGYLPEALLNFIALLGWNPKTEQEIFSLEELGREFAVEKINKAGAIFDLDKLDFINRAWQKRLSLPEQDPLFKKGVAVYQSMFKPTLAVTDAQETIRIIWRQAQERIRGPREIEKLSEFTFYDKEPDPSPDLLVWKDTLKETTKKNLELLLKFLEKQETFTGLEPKILNHLAEQGIGKGEALWPLRVALTGLQNSPGPFETLEGLEKKHGRQKVLDRIKKAIEKLK